MANKKQKEVLEQSIDGWRAASNPENPAPQLDDQILLGLKF